MFRRSNAFSISFWSITVLIAGCASHDSGMIGGRQASKNTASYSGNHPGLPEKMPDILPQTHFAAAELFESQGEYEKAIEQYKKAIVVNHNFASAYHRLGLVYGSTGRHDEAVESLDKAVQMKPQNAVFRNNLAYEYMHLNRWNDAESELRAAIEIQPGLNRAHINLALTLSHGNRFDEALAEFKTVLPETDAYYNLGLLYRGQQQYAKAAETFRHVLALDAKFTAAKTQLEQVSGLIESRVAEQRNSAVAVQEMPTIEVQDEFKKPKDLRLPNDAQLVMPEAQITANLHPQDVALAAADVLDHEQAVEETHSDEATQNDTENALNREVLLSLARLAQIVQNEANCTEVTGEAPITTAIDTTGEDLVLAQVAEDQNEKSALQALVIPPAPTAPCIEPLVSEQTDEDAQWALAGLAGDEPNRVSHIEVQFVPGQSTDCAPLDVFAVMQNRGVSARENLLALSADFSTLAVQALLEQFELVQTDQATRREHWFQDFRELEGLLSITENEAFCLDVFGTNEILGIVENRPSNTGWSMIANRALQLTGAGDSNAMQVRDNDSDDTESSSIARASGSIPPPSDRN